MNEKQMLDYLKDIYQDLEKSPKETDGYDCISHEHKLYIELKARRTHYDTLLLEVKKYNFLIDNATELGYEALYINWTPKGMWLFKLDPDVSKYKWETKWLPKNTDFGGSYNIDKLVTFLNIEDGEQLL